MENKEQEAWPYDRATMIYLLEKYPKPEELLFAMDFYIANDRFPTSEEILEVIYVTI